MGKETISSQELSEYTHVNSTQIRRDLSGFGKFGKRGVGYNVDSLVSQIRKILRTSGQHNIALFGAGHLGIAIASSDIFADHGFRVVAIFDPDPEKIGEKVGNANVRHPNELRQVVEEEDIVVGVLAVPDRRRPAARRPARRRGREDHLQLLRGAAAGAAGGHGPHVEPRGRPPLRAVLLPDLTRMIDVAAARDLFEDSTDGTVGIEEEFALLDPQDHRLMPAFERLRDAGMADDDPRRRDRGRADLLGDRDPLGPRHRLRGRAAPPARGAAAAVRARRPRGRAVRRDRHAPAVGLPGPARHRHAPLPPRRGRPEVRGLAQQHVLAARPRRDPRRRSRRAGVRPPAPGAAAAARGVGQLALRRPDGLGPALRPHADLHQVVPALRRPRRVRQLAGVGRLRRPARAHELDHRVHPAVVVGAAAPRLRDRRGARLRRPDDGRRGRRAGGADRRLRAAGRRRGRRGRDAARRCPGG